LRKIRIFAHMSADAIVQPAGDDEFAVSGWSGKYRSAAGAEALAQSQGTYDLLLGRHTYDMWSGFWPKQQGGPFAGAINAAKKYVMTHRSTGLDWGPVEAILPDIAENVRRVKATDGPDLVVWGTTTLTPLLFEQGLVDEVELLVYPILLGQGIRFFSDRVAPHELEFVSSRSTPTGVVRNSYKYVGPVKRG